MHLNQLARGCCTGGVILTFSAFFFGCGPLFRDKYSYLPAIEHTPVNLRTEYLTSPIGIDVTPRFSWAYLGSERNHLQRSYRLLVSSSTGRLERNHGDLWDSGEVESARNINIEYAGKALRSGQTCYWKVTTRDQAGRRTSSETARFEMGLLSQSDWSGEWIGPSHSQPSSPLLRKEFSLDGKIEKARAYIAGLGWAELYVNGVKVGNHVLSPPNTLYQQRVLYESYDVTDLLKPGKNAIGIWLGNGYGTSYSIWGFRWLLPMTARLQLNIDYANGGSARIVTDRTWKASGSPVVSNCIYNGEKYDARLEQDGWSKPDFDDSGWTLVQNANAPSGLLRGAMGPPIRVVDTIKPVEITKTAPGIYVADFGQNVAGWALLKAKGVRGTKIVMRYSELLGKDGAIDPWTNRNAQATDTYVLKGSADPIGPEEGEVEIYEPRFTYHGFRYVEVAGYPGKLTKEAVQARVVHADVASTGVFSTSNDLMNRLQSNIRWGLMNNLMSIPTDAPQRDERTPCLMDSMVAEETAIHNFDMAAYYTKWLGDVLRAARGTQPDWGGDQINLAWNLYQYYDDKRVLQDNFEHFRKYVETMDPPDHILRYGFGDWASPSVPPGGPIYHKASEVNTGILYRSAVIVSRMASILGKEQEARSLAGRAERIKRAYNEEFWNHEQQCYGDGSQTTSILPLAFGLVSEERKSPVLRRLLHSIRNEKQDHLDTGIFATKHFLEVLADNGSVDVAINVLLQETYPSFGYQIKNGATTTWEWWAVKSPLNSHDHAMFSGIGASFYTRLAGIRPLSPGYYQIAVEPVVPKQLDQATCTMHTLRGPIAINWVRKGSRLIFDISIPGNSVARVRIPLSDATIKESGTVIWTNGEFRPGAEGVIAAQKENGGIVLHVGSGEYHFSARPA